MGTSVKQSGNGHILKNIYIYILCDFPGSSFTIVDNLKDLDSVFALLFVSIASFSVTIFVYLISCSSFLNTWTEKKHEDSPNPPKVPTPKNKEGMYWGLVTQQQSLCFRANLNVTGYHWGLRYRGPSNKALRHLLRCAHRQALMVSWLQAPAVLRRAYLSTVEYLEDPSLNLAGKFDW